MCLYKLALVLNASYEPINIVTARRAMTLVLKGTAVVQHASAFTVRTAKLAMPLPSVVRLLVYRRMPKWNRAVTRKSIMLRDGNTCQYCRETLPLRALTLDHVVPRCRGGANTWENLVACCHACNNRKADRTPSEAGMSLARKPGPVSIHAKHRLMTGADVPEWEPYLFC